MIRPTAQLAAALTAFLLPSFATAQTGIALGSLATDPEAPVEVTAESLTVDQTSGAATFTGNVVIGQGGLKISAAEVEVFYDGESGEISRLEAAGGVTFVTETEEAEANEAVYDLSTGLLTLTGDVLLTQGATALSSQSMVVNLNDNTAQLEGGVRTVFERGSQ